MLDTTTNYKINRIAAKELAGSTPNIIFDEPVKASPPTTTDSKQSAPVKSESLVQVHQKAVGRPKNAKLSALAAKRSVGRAKPTSSQVSSPSLSEQKTVLNSDAKVDKEKVSKKTFDLSSVDRLALTQNITHMASQVRPEPMTIPDVMGLMQGLRYDEVPIKRRLKAPSRGMILLFPGKNNKSRANHVSNLLMSSSFHRPVVDQVVLNQKASMEAVIPFDFNTCPIEAVAEAVKGEIEALKRKKKQHAKRLVDYFAQPKPLKKLPNANLDQLSARRLLKKRVKNNVNRGFSILFCGPGRAGKSTIVSSLLMALDTSSISDKEVAKVKWDAEKAGRPFDYLAWMVDELPAERRCGHSWYLGEVSLSLPSGRSCHLLDCPGGQLGLFSDLLPSVHAVVIVVDVTRMACEDELETKDVKDLLKVLKQRSIESLPQTIFILNKMDRCIFSRAEVIKAKDCIKKLTSDIFGSQNFIHFVPSCALTGQGLTPLKVKPKPENGKVNFADNFIDILENVKTNMDISPEPSPVDLKPPVLQIRDIYENMGAGFTAVAFVNQGLVASGQTLICLPSNVNLSVRSVLLARCGRLESVHCAVAGETVHLVLWQVEMNAVTRGSVICHPLLKPSEIDTEGVQFGYHFEAEIETVDLHGRSLFTGRQVMFHGFGFSVPAFVRRLLWVRASSDGYSEPRVKLHPMVVSRTGAAVGIELFLETPYACIPSMDVGVKFSLLDDSSLLATGILKKVLEDNPAVDALRIPDCFDSKRLLFHRSGEFEPMEVN